MSLSMDRLASNCFSPSKVAACVGPADYRDAAAVQSLVLETLDALSLPSDFIRPNDKVVLKPNWVKEHDERKPGPGQWEHIVTHPAVIEATERFKSSGSFER